MILIFNVYCMVDRDRNVQAYSGAGLALGSDIQLWCYVLLIYKVKTVRLFVIRVGTEVQNEFSTIEKLMILRAQGAISKT